MNITIFGATGGTGREVVRLALEVGHQVTAIARDPGAIGLSHERLRVRQGDVLDPSSLPAALEGSDAVVSALGSPSGRKPTSVYSAGVSNVLAAMGAAGVRRFVGISAAPVIPRSDRTAFERLTFPILYRFFGGSYADMRRMEDLLRNSQVDWTVLRPPRLTDKAPTGHYRTAREQNVVGGRKITRSDLALAMLDMLGDEQGARAALGVAS